MEEKPRILIVDDEPINLDFFDVMLSKLGFEVERAVDGEDALEKVQTVEPDLLLLDNIMPKLSGWEVTRYLKSSPEYQEYSDIPIIMFSAMDDVRDKVEGFELGVDDYITKPFNFSEVLARIRAVLRHRTMAQEIAAKQRRLDMLESLNQSLIHVTHQLKDPVMDLQERAESVDIDDEGGVDDFVQTVRTEAGEIIAALEGLEDEIRELEDLDMDEEKRALSLSDLEQRFQQHFQALKSGETGVDEVSK